jgi:hypothetical protein
VKVSLHTVGAIAVLIQWPALAGDPGNELKARISQKTDERIQIHFEIRSRVEFRNELEFGFGTPQHGDFIRTRAGVTVQPAGWLRLSVLGQDARVPFLGRPAPGTMRDPFDLQEAYAEFLGNTKRGFTADLGRRMLQYGDTRLIGAPQWAYTARTYDYARAAWRTGKHRFEALFISPIKPAGQSFNRPVLGDRVWGTYNTLADVGRHATLDLYALRHDQNRPGGFTGAGRLETNSFGFRLVMPVNAAARITAEAIGQTGSIGGLPHRAYAWVIQPRWKTSVAGRALDTAAEYKFASGSRDAHRSGSFDQLYPAAHDKLGHADVLGWRNVRNVKVTSVLSVSKALSLTAMYNDSWLAVRTDAAYNLQGRPIARSLSGLAGSHLGREADLFAAWTRGPLTLAGGFGYFFTGRFLRITTPGLDQRLLYFSQTYSF